MSITLERLGDLAAEREQLKEAEEFYRKSLDIRSRLAPGSAVEADAYHGLGMIERKAGRLRDAADLLRNAVGALELQKGKLGGPEEAKSSFAAKYADYYRDYIKVLIELNQREDAFKTLERFRARALLARLAERDLVFSADVPPALERERKLADAEYDRTQNQIRELNPKEHATQVDELLSHLRELRTSRDEIAQKIKKASPRYASLQYPQPLDLAGTLAALDPGTLLLSYCVGKEKSYVFVVSSDPKRGPPLSVITIASGEKALRESVEAFRKLIEWNKPSPDLVSRGRSLYDKLIQPAEGLIGKADRILILPDGPLHTLPWGALVRDVKGRKPRCLIEWKPLHTAVSATVYAELKRSRREKATPAPSIAIAAFGDPKYLNLPVKTGTKRGSEEENKDTESAEDIADPEVRLVVRGGHRFDPLPATRKEVETIVSLYVPRAKTFLGEQATEERAKSIGKDIPLIHFACHAFVNERFPLDSGLALTIPEKPKEAQDNGLLQAWEIFEKVRIDADLVTLSACESGLGKEMGGEGLIGLARAFQYAGARAVLASLWKVEDQSTGELMKRFYSYLKAGKTKDEALRLAQIDLIHSPDLAQPIHWAAFQLIGDWK
jgi:CHAT domain-containing protein